MTYSTVRVLKLLYNIRPCHCSFGNNTCGIPIFMPRKNAWKLKCVRMDRLRVRGVRERKGERGREGDKVKHTYRVGGGREGGERVLREERHPPCSGGSNVSRQNSPTNSVPILFYKLCSYGRGDVDLHAHFWTLPHFLFR